MFPKSMRIRPGVNKGCSIFAGEEQEVMMVQDANDDKKWKVRCRGSRPSTATLGLSSRTGNVEEILNSIRQ